MLLFDCNPGSVNFNFKAQVSQLAEPLHHSVPELRSICCRFLVLLYWWHFGVVLYCRALHGVCFFSKATGSKGEIVLIFIFIIWFLIFLACWSWLGKLSWQLFLTSALCLTPSFYLVPIQGEQCSFVLIFWGSVQCSVVLIRWCTWCLLSATT